jgi:hypothetical protein
MLEVNHVHPEVSAEPFPPMKSVINHNERARLAPMTGRAMRPPSLSVSFHTFCPFNIFPRKRMMGKASMGSKRMNGAYSNAVL